MHGIRTSLTHSLLHWICLLKMDMALDKNVKAQHQTFSHTRVLSRRSIKHGVIYSSAEHILFSEKLFTCKNGNYRFFLYEKFSTKRCDAMDGLVILYEKNQEHQQSTVALKALFWHLSAILVGRFRGRTCVPSVQRLSLHKDRNSNWRWGWCFCAAAMRLIYNCACTGTRAFLLTTFSSHSFSSRKERRAKQETFSEES